MYMGEHRGALGMARPRNQGRVDIAGSGREAAARKANNTRHAVVDAMRKIEADIERNEGIYPFADGVVSSAEVLRRAGLSAAALQKKQHRELRDGVNAWVAGIASKLARGATVVRRAVTERVDDANEEVRRIRQRWVEADLEYTDTTRENADLKNEVAKLKAENAQLRLALAGANVLQIRTPGGQAGMPEPL
jgi:hypothetical protein